MPTCFVIQPFDKGKYDKRYDDVIKPAIEAAGLEPYRVDRDPRVSIPIDEIERGIQESAICLAEISTDNANVWFEIGYAIAIGKEVCMVCSAERSGNFPFDIQHRQVIRYATDSTRDFEIFKKEVTERLSGLLKKERVLSEIQDRSPLKDTEGLSNHEMVALISVMENRLFPDSCVHPSTIQRDMNRLGYTGLATSIAVERLTRKGFLVIAADYDDRGNEYPSYRLTDDGVTWLLNNEELLTLKDSKPRKRELDDDIPF